MTAARILDLARDTGVLIATAESCTGGLIAAALTEVPGSSDVVDRGFVTYSNAAKTQMLGVPAQMIEASGAVSEDVAAAMAEGALARSEADLRGSLDNDSLTEDEIRQIEEDRAKAEAAAELREDDYQLAYAIDILTGLSALGPSE